MDKRIVAVLVRLANARADADKLFEAVEDLTVADLESILETLEEQPEPVLNAVSLGLWRQRLH